MRSLNALVDIEKDDFTLTKMTELLLFVLTVKEIKFS